MLSQQNIEKLKMNGLYKCEADAKYRGKMHPSNLYHCCNWTFRVIKNNEGDYFMRDTYWNDSESLHIPLTNETIDDFKLLFEIDKVKPIKKHEVTHYEDYYRVAIDSGGWSYPKLFVDVDKYKSKNLIIEEIDEKIKSLEWEIKHLREKKANIENGTYKLEWV